MFAQHSEPAKPEEPENLVAGPEPDQEPGGDRGGWGNPRAVVDLLQQDQQPATSCQTGEASHPLHGTQSRQVRLQIKGTIGNSSFRDWEQFEFMRELPCLEELVFLGNPLEEDSSEEGVYTRKVKIWHLPT